MIGDIIRAVGSFIGGRQQNEANIEAQQNMAAQNIALQREFAQSGIRWKVADAREAGVHPLFALGASTHSFSPVSVGSSQGNPLGDAMSHLGSAVDAGIKRTESAGERQEKAIAKSLLLEKAGLENELLRAQIASTNARTSGAQGNPSMPVNQRYLIDGQGSTATGDNVLSKAINLIKEKPMERTPSAPGAAHQEPGSLPDVGYARTRTGWAPVPSKDVKERIEDNIIQEVMWSIRNNVMPSFGMYDPPKFSPPVGKKWMFHPLKQEYQHWDQPPGWWRRFDR